jgi:hypothetical protein
LRRLTDTRPRRGGKPRGSTANPGRRAHDLSLRPDKLARATDVVPERYDLGTPPYEVVQCAGAAVDFIASATPGGGSRRDRLARSLEAFDEHKQRLRAVAENGLLDLGASRLPASG